MTSCVTVIIAAYNAEATIKRAIDSALAEAETTEIMLIDDASTDHTIERAKEADDGSGRLKILSQPQNSGPSAARNRAVEESTAPWIAILDADDFFLPGRLKGLLSFAPNADMIADDMWQVSEHDINGPRKALLDTPLTAPKPIDFTTFVSSNISRPGRQRGELGLIKPLIRRQFLTQHSIRYQEQMRLGEDFELYARALALGARLLLVPAQGYVSVVRATSLSGQHSEEDLRQLRDSDHALQTLPLSSKERKILSAHYKSIDCRLQWRLLILAVKRRNLRAAIATFARPYPVPFYLMKQLAIQCIERSLGKGKKAP